MGVRRTSRGGLREAKTGRRPMAEIRDKSKVVITSDLLFCKEN